jgi:archaellum biogenesis ATPase FlaH
VKNIKLNEKMSDSVINVEREVDKVINKFNELRQHNDQTLNDLIQQIQSYQRDLLILTSESSIH